MKTLLDFDHKKAIQAINFFASKKVNSEINKLKAVKLIWLADRYHLRKYGRPIANDTYYAMRLGPVASSVKDILGFNMLGEVEEGYLNNYLSLKSPNTIKAIRALDEDVFSKTEIEALEKIHTEYGSFNSSDLVNLSHEFPEWKKFKKVLENGSSTREIMKYEDFFGNPDNRIRYKNIFSETSEKLKVSKAIFEENFSIASFWT